MTKIHIIIISPASAKANNGNWQTASRWAHFLRTRYRVTVLTQWDGARCDLMIALHARRSAASIAAFATAHPTLPVVLVLTGTDLYRDIRHDADAQRSLQLATRLIVLQQAGLDELTPDLRSKAQLIHQSARQLTAVDRSVATRYFNVVMIGHLRDEKDPQTFMRAAALLAAPLIRMWQIGGALTPALQAQAALTQVQQPHYRWLGNMAHAATRQRLKRSHLLVIPSTMEGGANVIIEAVTSGVPVLASDISGNRGMLGDDYAGHFPVGDAAALATMIERALLDPAFYARLQQQCAARAPLFAPQQERAALLCLVDNLVKQ